jgi:hypothetical protein
MNTEFREWVQKSKPSGNPYGKPVLGLLQVEFQPVFGPFYACVVGVEDAKFSSPLCCPAHLLLILQGSASDPGKTLCAYKYIIDDL